MQTSSPQRLGEGNESRAGVLRVRAANDPSVITITEKAPIPVQHSVINVKALLGTFNQEKAPIVEPMDRFTALFVSHLSCLLLCSSSASTLRTHSRHLMDQSAVRSEVT